jgi:hypothetical protein
MANAFQILNAEYVEVAIPASPKQQNFFPDLPNLRNKPIMGIEAYSVLEQGVTNSGATVQAVADLVNASVTLYFDGGEYIVVPITSLRRINKGAAATYYGDIPNLAGQNIVWTKSYVTMTNAATLANYANKSFLFNVYYKR